ncbi:hybrid sensor histidine kinase/response regulator [Achromobacter xylosoxidans]
MAATLLSRTDAGARMGERIRYSSGRMQRLISQVLDLSRLQGGMGLGIEKRECLLSELLNGLIDEKRQAYPGLRIEPEVQPGLTLMADTDRIAQVVTNLMSNARQHGAPRMPIRVSATQTGDTIELAVANHGAPIPDEVMAHLFSPFKPESLGHSRNRNGLGLGLYIADRVVRDHEGDITVACRDGLVIFTVTLPRGMDAPPPLESWRDHLNDARALRVLLVDDNEMGSELLAEFLALSGLETRCAGTGEDALAQAGAFAPQAVLVDILLPDMDGYELARRLRERDSAARIYALSGLARHERHEDAANLFDGWIEKPADPDALLALLRQAD